MSRVILGHLEAGSGEDDTVKVDDDLKVNGNLEVTEDLSVDGNIVVTGNITIGGTLVSVQAVTAWVHFDGSVDPPVINDSYNVASIVRNSTGNYTITFSSAFDNTNYCAVSMSKPLAASFFGICAELSRSTTTLTIETGDLYQGGEWYHTSYNSPSISIAIFGGRVL